MLKFIPGLQLCELFYNQAVKPILDKNFPDLKYSAALIGSGSEVLGVDTAQSMDHHWGPRVQIFLTENDYKTKEPDLKNKLSNELPTKFNDFSTNWSEPNIKGVQQLRDVEKGPVNHRVVFTTIKIFLNKYLGFDPNQELKNKDWLLIPEQKLLTITSGKVYSDGLGELDKTREKFSYYPNDVWLYILASQWDKISQEEAFVGRCGDVGDELGSQIIATRIISYIMKLCFLMEKRYAPYSKWFGTAFSKLKAAPALNPIFQKIIKSNSWMEREKYLSQAYEYVAEKHNKLGITPPLETKTSGFYNRPYQVIHGENFARAIQAKIQDKEIKDIPLTVGSIDQFADAVSVLYNADIYKKLNIIYEK